MYDGWSSNVSGEQALTQLFMRSAAHDDDISQASLLATCMHSAGRQSGVAAVLATSKHTRG